MIKKELVVPGMEYSRHGFSKRRRVDRLEINFNGHTKVYYEELDGDPGIYILIGCMISRKVEEVFI